MHMPCDSVCHLIIQSQSVLVVSRTSATIDQAKNPEHGRMSLSFVICLELIVFGSNAHFTVLLLEMRYALPPLTRQSGRQSA